ncbi:MULTISPECIES: AAA domain-containing protein [unclassified Nocardiopsis]|uniref:AAA domain-containing protein n=1 Tax=Nocardiopsis TaxID=2013 RepID=UPI00387B1091
MFQFLVESEELRTTPVRTLEGAARILWFEDLPRDAPGIVSGLLDPEDSDQWLRMERVDRTGPPLPPEELHAWVDLLECRDPQREEPPALLDTPLEPVRPRDVGLPVDEDEEGDGETGSEDNDRDGDQRSITLDEHPDRDVLRAAHAAWARTWSAWADRERVVRRRARLYEEAFRIHQEAVDLGESYELVLGFGHLAWASEGQAVRRHLLTRRVVLSLDDRGTLEVGLDPDALGFALEEDMLEVAQRLREEDRAKVLEHLGAAAEHEGTGALEDLHTALREWTVRAAADAAYDPGAARRPADGNRPQVSFAPALVLRERPKRGQLNALTTIVETLRRQGGEPELLRHIVGEGEGGGAPAAAGTGGAAGGGGSDHEELYFSLPSNAEQREIATRLRDSDLVVVQGPPGTGKTHTIANLVTDLLAHGQRILITSQTTRALKVLKDKLPEEIRPLAVSRTGDGVEAQRELEASVRAILERQSQHDDRSAETEVSRLQDRLDHARGRRDRTLKELRAIRERETHLHPEGPGGYGGTLSQIARKLVDDEAAHSWLGPVPGFERTLTAQTAHALLAAARAFTPEQRAIAAEMPGADELPDPAAHARAVEDIRRAEQAAAESADVWDTATEEVLTRLSRQESARMRGLLTDFTTRRDRTRRLDPHWAEQRSAVLAGRDRQVRTQAERVRTEVRRAETELAAIADVRVDGLDAFAFPDALRHATALKEGFAAGRRLKGPLGMRTRLYKDHAVFLESVTVDGSALDTPEELALVHHRIALERRVGDALRAAGRPADLDWSDPLERLAPLREDLDDLDRLLELADAHTALTAATEPVPALAALDWADDTRVDRLTLLLAAVDARHDAVPARELISSALSLLYTWSDRQRARSGAAPSPLGRARTALEDADTDAYERALADMERARAAHRLEQEYRAAERAVAEHHRGLAAAVTADPGDERWEERLGALDHAWAWSAWNHRLAELTDPKAEEDCRARLAEADGEVRLTMGRLAAAKAWRSCLSRLTADQEVALRAYQQSIRRIGKGTGRHAARHQRQARESLRDCQPAVPAWIMPLYQVVSTVPMDRPGAFDVVIIDEASQSGPEALLLAWLGKRLVVVGDDKQVSPRNAGLDQDQLFALQERRLASFSAPRRNLFAPNNSLFDIAAGLAGSRGQLMLSEHFRCMPEIIGFSNEEFYQGRLQPLRQYAADRLPPVRTVHVAEGMVEGRGQKQVNRAEARALVDRVVRCCADPAYEGRTMGVVTLLGTAQQALIEELLTDVLSLDVRVERQIRVGNASAFQGDERDVMFLGCVYAPFDVDGVPRRPSPFSSVPDQQIINVAASRARDQVWVFHSFALSDLGETDMRRRYLDHLSRPAEDQIGTGLGEVPADERVEPFDSLFEQRVYRALHERGYRVRPQYRAGRYRIDLVVEGGTRRLAVECDGDAFHTEENAPDDAARQRELERVGWTFVRIRGSRFFRDPQESLNPLWKQLEAMGIEPARA